MSLKTIQALVTVAAASLLLISCSSEEPTSDPQKPDSQPKQVTPRGAPARNEIVEKMDADGKGMHLTATSPEGKKIKASIGDEIEIPDEFPKDVPIFPGSTPMAFMSAPGEGIIVTFKSGEKQQDILDFYRSSLADGGWEILKDTMFTNQLSMEAIKDNRKISVIVAGTKGDSRVSVIVTPED